MSTSREWFDMHQLRSTRWTCHSGWAGEYSSPHVPTPARECDETADFWRGATPGNRKVALPNKMMVHHHIQISYTEDGIYVCVCATGASPLSVFVWPALLQQSARGKSKGMHWPAWLAGIHWTMNAPKLNFYPLLCIINKENSRSTTVVDLWCVLVVYSALHQLLFWQQLLFLRPSCWSRFPGKLYRRGFTFGRAAFFGATQPMWSPSIPSKVSGQICLWAFTKVRVDLCRYSRLLCVHLSANHDITKPEPPQ